ncbi:WD repeat-containing protein on Y chromosome [Eumeta japonica]|uniref:WD repeat-containing protein on Y chromosome n=1 Tax=Eumeta variegata TaxID=151549 RepID=A0A4C1XIJ9_EUMVA|nr:WD repeat-containing protein on Y chromosome [Eumeta japonica]
MYLEIIAEDDASRVYSLSRDRVIKVWDVHAQTCVQTYIDIPSSVGERAPLSCAYNPHSRELVVGAIDVAVLSLDERLDTRHTDGSTHSRAVSCVLYNPLFKIIITCGLDSNIMNWDPATGDRNVIVLKAHTCPRHGELVPVEITAACFDPGYLLLLTGARDGSVQVWNFNTGVRLRRMNIEHMCEVTNVFWVEGRILAIGWNRHITEFEDTSMATTGKAWETRHTDDVLASAFRPPLSLVTSSYNSEMVMWKLETGQAYRRYSCVKPTERIKMSYGKRAVQRADAAAGAGGKQSSRGRKQTIKKTTGHTLSCLRWITIEMAFHAVPLELCLHHFLSYSTGSAILEIDRTGGAARVNVIEPSEAILKAQARKENPVTEKTKPGGMREVAVHSMTFLQTRPFHSQVGSLMVGLENGKIQCWSDHPAGGYKGSFQAVHSPGDYVSAMTTDGADQFLFCGTAIGYIKVWLMTNYFRGEEVHVNMPALRLEFPFTWRDRVVGRAKRSVRGQRLPVLLNSYRAHTRRITSLAYVQDKKLLFSGSTDYSVRVWRLSGEYVQTLGGLWVGPPDELHFPPDVNKIISSTTLKVFRHGEVSRFTPGLPDPNAGDELRGVTEEELMTLTTGVRAEEPLLGTHLQLPRRPEHQDAIVLDDSLAMIPLYRHLRLASTHTVRRPPTPELVRATRVKRERKKTAHFAPNVPIRMP